jgi:hypothetical protein
MTASSKPKFFASAPSALRRSATVAHVMRGQYSGASEAATSTADGASMTQS